MKVSGTFYSRHKILCLSILQGIERYIQIHGYSPSIRDVGDAIHVESTSLICFYLDRLKEEGYLNRDSAVSRTMHLTPLGKETLKEANEKETK